MLHAIARTHAAHGIARPHAAPSRAHRHGITRIASCRTCMTHAIARTHAARAPHAARHRALILPAPPSPHAAHATVSHHAASHRAHSYCTRTASCRTCTRAFRQSSSLGSATQCVSHHVAHPNIRPGPWHHRQRCHALDKEVTNPKELDGACAHSIREEIVVMHGPRLCRAL